MSSNFQLPAGLKPANPPPSGGQQGGPPGPGGQDEEARQAQMQQKQQEEEMRRGMLGQILEPSARERCTFDHYPTTASSFLSSFEGAYERMRFRGDMMIVSRIAMIRPSQAEQIERQLINLARSGQLTRKLGDDELRGMLEQVRRGRGRGLLAQPSLA